MNGYNALQIAVIGGTIPTWAGCTAGLAGICG